MSYLTFNILILLAGLSLRYLSMDIPNSLAIRLGVVVMISIATIITFTGLFRDFITSRGKVYSNTVLTQQLISQTHIKLWIKYILGMAFFISFIDFGNLKQMFVDTLLCVIGLSAYQTFKFSVIYFLSFIANREIR